MSVVATRSFCCCCLLLLLLLPWPLTLGDETNKNTQQKVPKRDQTNNNKQSLRCRQLRSGLDLLSLNPLLVCFSGVRIVWSGLICVSSSFQNKIAVRWQTCRLMLFGLLVEWVLLFLVGRISYVSFECCRFILPPHCCWLLLFLAYFSGYLFETRQRCRAFLKNRRSTEAI